MSGSHKIVSPNLQGWQYKFYDPLIGQDEKILPESTERTKIPQFIERVKSQAPISELDQKLRVEMTETSTECLSHALVSQVSMCQQDVGSTPQTIEDVKPTCQDEKPTCQAANEEVGVTEAPSEVLPVVPSHELSQCCA
jgi:hypothetical protein